MLHSLYVKWIALLLAVLLIAMSVLSVLFYQRFREDKFDDRMNTLQTEASDIANLISLAYEDPAVTSGGYFVWKVEEIMRKYDAVILIFDLLGNNVPIGENSEEILTNEFMKEETLPLLENLVAGNPIQAKTIQHDTGNPMFTVGVPILWNDIVQGGVFIHTSEQNIVASYQVVSGGLIRALIIALTIGTFLVFIFCTLVTKPLHAMVDAAEHFARGDFQQRVNVDSRDEVGKLAKSFNSMAADLERLEQTRREFIANVSHELRSPLTSMRGFLCGILDGTVPEPDRNHYLGIVLDETERLSKLINTLLDLSQIENGNTQLQMADFNINEAIAQVLIRCEARVNALHLDVNIDFPDENLSVHADYDRIVQVLTNIIDNALKHVTEGGRIMLSTRKEKGLVRVAIEDTGCGIAAEDLPYIFDRFYMADKAHTKGNGTGLGLSIAKKIINQHGQTITVTSEIQKGTRFEFTLEGAY